MRIAFDTTTDSYNMYVVGGDIFITNATNMLIAFDIECRDFLLKAKIVSFKIYARNGKTVFFMPSLHKLWKNFVAR